MRVPVTWISASSSDFGEPPADCAETGSAVSSTGVAVPFAATSTPIATTHPNAPRCARAIVADWEESSNLDLRSSNDIAAPLLWFMFDLPRAPAARKKARPSLIPVSFFFDKTHVEARIRARCLQEMGVARSAPTKSGGIHPRQLPARRSRTGNRPEMHA